MNLKEAFVAGNGALPERRSMRPDGFAKVPASRPPPVYSSWTSVATKPR